MSGGALLLENIGETLDPVLETLLGTKKGSREIIKIGDK
jgi:hypothetical protein